MFRDYTCPSHRDQWGKSYCGYSDSTSSCDFRVLDGVERSLLKQCAPFVDYPQHAYNIKSTTGPRGWLIEAWSSYLCCYCALRICQVQQLSECIVILIIIYVWLDNGQQNSVIVFFIFLNILIFFENRRLFTVLQNQFFLLIWYQWKNQVHWVHCGMFWLVIDTLVGVPAKWWSLGIKLYQLTPLVLRPGYSGRTMSVPCYCYLRHLGTTIMTTIKPLI